MTIFIHRPRSFPGKTCYMLDPGDFSEMIEREFQRREAAIETEETGKDGGN